MPVPQALALSADRCRAQDIVKSYIARPRRSLFVEASRRRGRAAEREPSRLSFLFPPLPLSSSVLLLALFLSVRRPSLTLSHVCASTYPFRPFGRKERRRRSDPVFVPFGSSRSPFPLAIPFSSYPSRAEFPFTFLLFFPRLRIFPRRCFFRF